MKKTESRGMYEDIISLLTPRSSGKWVRPESIRDAQVLGSSGKQIAHLLPTLLMTINQLDKSEKKKKKCAKFTVRFDVRFDGAHRDVN